LWSQIIHYANRNRTGAAVSGYICGNSRQGMESQRESRNPDSLQHTGRVPISDDSRITRSSCGGTDPGNCCQCIGTSSTWSCTYHYWLDGRASDSRGRGIGNGDGKTTGSGIACTICCRVNHSCSSLVEGAGVVTCDGRRYRSVQGSKGWR